MRIPASALLLLLAANAASAADTPVDFNREVRPILSDRCFGCHGPDANKGRKAGLRLDEIEGATKKLKSGETAVIAGDTDKSALVHRIRSNDPEEVMPPPDLHRPLTAAQKDILARWIKQGAKYDRHWAFVSPQSHPTPTLQDTSWPKDPIDHFILNKANQAGLNITAPADRTTLLRRASFALTGLPPTLAEVDAFLADPSPDAYEKASTACLPLHASANISPSAGWICRGMLTPGATQAINRCSPGPGATGCSMPLIIICLSISS